MNSMIKRLFIAVGLIAFIPQTALALEIESWKTANGVKVLFVESHDLPIIDVRLAFKAGSSRDGVQPGLSRLVNALLVEGTGNLSAIEIASKFESTGAELGHDSLRDMAWVSLRSLSDASLWEKTIDLFARVSALPSFPQDAIDRDRKSMLISLASREKDIGSVAEDAFFKNLYQGHAYEIGQQGTVAGLKSISQQDLQRFHAQFYVANNATLALVGDLTLEQAKDYANQLTKHLKKGEEASALKSAKAPDQGKVVNIPFKTSQTHIQMGMPILSRKDPDYFPLYVGNHILGGSGFSSRLMQEIRENRGLSYSVYSYFIPMEKSGPFQMGLQTKNHQVTEAGELLQSMLEDFIAGGATAEELEHAKKNITGSFPLKLDSNKKIVEYLSLIGFYHLSLDYLDRFNERVMDVTLDDIQDAFSRRVHADKIIRVVVGESS